MKKNWFLLLVMIGAGLVIFSCKDDDNTPPGIPEIVPTQVSLEIQTRVGSEIYIPGNKYDINGSQLQIDVAQFYLGNIELDGGNEDYDIDKYFIGGGSENKFFLDSIKSDRYEIDFGIGVEPDLNSQTTEDFTTRADGDPLGIQDPSMHWNWNTGYKFLRIDGLVDTNGDGTFETAVQYHIRSDAYYKELESQQQVSIEGENDTITLRFDIAGLFKDIDISNGLSTHVGDNKELADKLLDNYTEAFSFNN